MLETSPVRETIRSQLGKRLALLVHVKGTGTEGKRVESVLSSVAKTWNERERLGVGIVEFDRKDKRERLLVSFLGIPEEGPDWVAVTFGKGKISPPMQGDEISENALNTRIASLTAQCTCLQTASNFGVDLPLKWSSSDDRSVVLLRDPASTGNQPVAASVSLRVMKPTLMVMGVFFLLVVFSGAVILFRRAETV